MGSEAAMTEEELRKLRNKKRADRKKRQEEKEKAEELVCLAALRMCARVSVGAPMCVCMTPVCLKEREMAAQRERDAKAAEEAAKRALMSDDEKREKRSKAINKKLRQIEQLRETLNAGGKLDADAMAKLEGEEALRAELASLSV